MTLNAPSPQGTRGEDPPPAVPPKPVPGAPIGIIGTVVVVRRSVVVVVGAIVVVVGAIVVVVGAIVVVVVVTTGAAHVGTVTWFPSRVTAPLRASTRP